MWLAAAGLIVAYERLLALLPQLRPPRVVLIVDGPHVEAAAFAKVGFHPLGYADFRSASTRHAATEPDLGNCAGGLVVDFLEDKIVRRDDALVVEDREVAAMD